MELFGLVFLTVALILIGVGVAVGLVACGVAAVLMGLGVVSSSVVIGIRSGRPATGVRAFLIQCGLFAGVPSGVICALIGHAFFKEFGSEWPVLVYGAIGGAFSGVAIAWFFDFIGRRIHRWSVARLQSSRVSAQTNALPSIHSP